MAEIVDIQDFRSRQTAKLEAEFAHYMDRAEALQAEGKNSTARIMLDKAKEVRKKLDRLRKPEPKPAPTPHLDPWRFSGRHVPFTYSADLGYPKETPPAP